jgi:hypothetical protein
MLVQGSADVDHVALFWTVVPDGVNTVTLRFAPDGTRLKRPVTTTVRPVNNVVVAREPYSAPRLPSSVILRAGDGHVIKRIVVPADSLERTGC